MFSFLTERPRSAHKALQDAFAYLIVLKHKARAGELGWELANDFDEHKEVWTSIRDLIKVNKPENVLPSFASLSSRQRLQSLELLDREARGCRDFGAARLPCTWPSAPHVAAGLRLPGNEHRALQSRPAYVSAARWRLLRRSAIAVHMALDSALAVTSAQRDCRAPPC
jgi:hypothetical protein